MSPAIVVVNPSALPLARRIAAVLPGSLIHADSDDADIRMTGVGAHLRGLFAEGQPIIGLCAAGILIRALAPLLVNKHAEPPVLAVSPEGGAVVPLLGGHHGANRLAATLAEALGGITAVTTAGDATFGIALDEPPPGWRLENPAEAKPVMAAALTGQPLALDGTAEWITDSSLPLDPAAPRRLVVSEKASAAGALVYRAPVIALGVGCERGTDPAELADLVTQTLAAYDLAAGSVACLASLDLKGDEAAMIALAETLSVPFRLFDAAALEAETPRLANPSEVVFQAVGCHGVAEAAALAAAGPEATLIVPKQRSARATCALALSPTPIDARAAGRARGRLVITGIGPGRAGWRTPAVSAAVAGADDLVGYGLYLDLLGPAAADKTRHQSALGAETERARKALDLAAEGRSVALVCSGDAGIYALATLVFELLDLEANPAWSSIDLAIEPGVSAMQAAAARAGAPLGHDFCAISLSDLLTPWPMIERRLSAAAEGDFVVAFYNPVSQRRRDQLPRAREILLTRRPPDTPVILARNLGRAGESLDIISLGDLHPDRVDMLTLVLVGNSASRRVEHGGRTWVYTPRGYGEGGRLETGDAS